MGNCLPQGGGSSERRQAGEAVLRPHPAACRACGAALITDFALAAVQRAGAALGGSADRARSGQAPCAAAAPC